MGQREMKPTDKMKKAVDNYRRQYFDRFGIWPKTPAGIDWGSMASVGKYIGDLREALGLERSGKKMSRAEKAVFNFKEAYSDKKRGNTCSEDEQYVPQELICVYATGQIDFEVVCSNSIEFGKPLCFKWSGEQYRYVRCIYDPLEMSTEEVLRSLKAEISEKYALACFSGDVDNVLRLKNMWGAIQEYEFSAKKVVCLSMPETVTVFGGTPGISKKRQFAMELAKRFLEDFEVSRPVEGMSFHRFPRVYDPREIADWFMKNLIGE